MSCEDPFALKHKKSICMCLDKTKSLRAIKNKIQLPKKWLDKTEESVMITYILDGRMRFLIIDREDVAPLLKEFGMITRYEGSGKERKIYGHHVPECHDANGFTSVWEETQLVCEDIKIYESDAIHLIACREFDKFEKLLRTYKFN